MELIERDVFLKSLETRFKDVAAGEGHCIFINGEAGIGKTSLVKKFLKQVEDESYRYIGACDSLFTPRPLAPLYDLALQIKEDWATKTQSIFSRTELFTKFVQELGSKNRPVILIFEDIHWADEATFDFVKFFARRIGRMKCLFILTYRDEEIGQQHPLINVLGDLAPDTFSRISLTPLSRQAVYMMANEKGYDAENLYRVSGGNPFYVNEVLASNSPGIPENIKDAVRSVYNRQEGRTKDLWQILSVIPEGIELNGLLKIDPSWENAIEVCIAGKVLIVEKNKIYFKHELYRRAIEESLSPYKRIALNKKILEIFLESFEEREEIERIVHYAKNANDNTLVIKYAPLAAWQAVYMGAHIQAAKLFFTAIEYSGECDNDQLVKLYEAYAYECYLINQINEAIIYQARALKIWQEKNEIEQTGNSMRFLSRLWWFKGNRYEAEKYGKQAIEILQSQQSSRAKAMAFSNMARLKRFSGENTESIEWASKALNIANEIQDTEVLCQALNNLGTAKWASKSSEESGKKLLLESLDISLKYSFHENAASVYSTIINNSIQSRDYEMAKQFLEDSINYCEERNLNSSKNYKLYLKSRMLMETGDWDQASTIVKGLLANPDQLGIIKIGALTVLSTIKTRRGEPDVLLYLKEAKDLAFITGEYWRIIPVTIAFLEFEWLNSKKIITDEELNASVELIQQVDNIYLKNEFDFWLKKTGRYDFDLPELYEPYKLLKEGKIAMAAKFWEKIGCPFEKAMALTGGTEDDKRNALSIFKKLGAEAMYKKIKMEMRASGIKKIPRGLRESTKTNPAQLTNRELDVLLLLRKGIHNKEIADTLFISYKTVDHHISSIFFKLQVNSRTQAVNEAIRLAIIN